MKPDSFLVTLMTFFLGLAGIVLFAGCELDAYVGEEVDTYVENDEIDTYVAPTTATIRGKVASVDESAILAGVVAKKYGADDRKKETGPAHNRRAHIVVRLDGPVSLVAETDDEGEFVFAEIAAGTYEVTFECDGVEVRYRGRSGQVATLTVGAAEILELTGIGISGGRVNIGNIRVLRDRHSHAEDDEEEETEPPEEPVPPLDLTGTWLLTTVSDAGIVHQRHLLLTHSGYQLTGEIVGSGEIVDGETDGETIELMVMRLAALEIVVTHHTGVVESPISLRGTWFRTDGVAGVWEGDKQVD